MGKLKINPLAAIVAIVIFQIVPATWYGIFAEPWMAANNLTLEIIGESDPMLYVTAIITAAITVYAMALIFRHMQIEDVITGVKVAALMWFGFLFAQVLTQNLFSLRGWEVTLIDQGSTFICFLASGALLGGWRKYQNA